MTKADTASLNISYRNAKRLRALFRMHFKGRSNDPEASNEVLSLIENIRDELASMIHREERRQKRRRATRIRLRIEGRIL
jgi:hypothetical protein